MGQKVNPIGMRLGIVRDWNASWYAERGDFARSLGQDIAIRKLVSTSMQNAGISDLRIERLTNNNMRITIHSARPGVVIGRKGEDVEKLRRRIARIVNMQVAINIEEIRKPELDAYLVAEGAARQLEKRIMFRRVMRRAVGNAMRLGAEGIKIAVSGRLNGADIARREWYREGRVPLHTLRAQISYGVCEASTTYGKIGVKVWIFHGEKFEEKKGASSFPSGQRARSRRMRSLSDGD